MFEIIVDSAANIPAEHVEKYRIHVIPFINYMGSKEIPGFEPGLTPEESGLTASSTMTRSAPARKSKLPL